MEIALAIAVTIALILAFTAGIVLGLLFHGVRIYQIQSDKEIPHPMAFLPLSDSDSAPTNKIISPFKREQTTFNES